MLVSKGFILDSKWIYKWINSGNWGNSAEIWENVANGTVYKEIIEVIQEII
jgi:hypothetical protein